VESGTKFCAALFEEELFVWQETNKDKKVDKKVNCLMVVVKNIRYGTHLYRWKNRIPFAGIVAKFIIKSSLLLTSKSFVARYYC
jgi:hypothetical protein